MSMSDTSLCFPKGCRGLAMAGCFATVQSTYGSGNDASNKCYSALATRQRLVTPTFLEKVLVPRGGETDRHGVDEEWFMEDFSEQVNKVRRDIQEDTFGELEQLRRNILIQKVRNARLRKKRGVAQKKKKQAVMEEKAVKKDVRKAEEEAKMISEASSDNRDASTEGDRLDETELEDASLSHHQSGSLTADGSASVDEIQPQEIPHSSASEQSSGNSESGNDIEDSDEGEAKFDALEDQRVGDASDVFGEQKEGLIQSEDAGLGDTDKDKQRYVLHYDNEGKSSESDSESSSHLDNRQEASRIAGEKSKVRIRKRSEREEPVDEGVASESEQEIEYPVTISSGVQPRVKKSKKRKHKKRTSSKMARPVEETEKALDAENEAALLSTLEIQDDVDSSSEEAVSEVEAADDMRQEDSPVVLMMKSFGLSVVFFLVCYLISLVYDRIIGTATVP